MKERKISISQGYKISFLCLTLFFSLTTPGCQTLRGENTVAREILAANLSFNVETGEIKYTLPEPALVRLRVGIKDGGPLVRTLVDWEKRKEGPQTEVWDKKDESGKAFFGPRQDYMIVLACLPLKAKKMNFKSSTIEGFRKSPQVLMSFPTAREKTEEGVVVIKGVVPVRVTIPEADRWILATKYEAGLYIDSVFLMEDEEGTNPFTYQLNTKGFNDGVHILTANIMGYDGEIGTKSVLMYVNNQKK